jgi:hypothetical protein
MTVLYEQAHTQALKLYVHAYVIHFNTTVIIYRIVSWLASPYTVPVIRLSHKSLVMNNTIGFSLYGRIHYTVCLKKIGTLTKVGILDLDYLDFFKVKFFNDTLLYSIAILVWWMFINTPYKHRLLNSTLYFPMQHDIAGNFMAKWKSVFNPHSTCAPFSAINWT